MNASTMQLNVRTRKTKKQMKKLQNVVSSLVCGSLHLLRAWQVLLVVVVVDVVDVAGGHVAKEQLG